MRRVEFARKSSSRVFRYTSSRGVVLQRIDPVQILCFTWNLGNAQPWADELHHWLPEGGANLDLVVIGTQENSFKPAKRKASAESVENDYDDSEPDDDTKQEGLMRQQSLVENIQHSMEGITRLPRRASSEIGFEDVDEALTEKKRSPSFVFSAWEEMVLERLGPGFAVCRHIIMWEMRLTVFARKVHLTGKAACITDVQAAASATGIAGVLGNKGGLVIKLRFGSTELAFISSHLAAHSHRINERNANCQEILEETRTKVKPP